MNNKQRKQMVVLFLIVAMFAICFTVAVSPFWGYFLGG